MTVHQPWRANWWQWVESTKQLMFELSGGISWRFQRNFWETSACMTSWRNPVQNVSAQQSTSQRTKSFAMSLFSEICRVMPPALFINYAQDLIHTAKWLMSLCRIPWKKHSSLLTIDTVNLNVCCYMYNPIWQVRFPTEYRSWLNLHSTFIKT